MDDEGLKDENAFMLLDDSDNIKAIAAACRKAKKLLTLGIVKQNGLRALKCWIQEHAQAGINLDTFLSVSLTPAIKRRYAQRFHNLCNIKVVAGADTPCYSFIE